jgi:hypothetical protein
VIQADGSVSHAKVLKDIGGGCGASALTMINSMNSKGIKWIPGKIDGKPVSVELTLPLEFNLIDGSGKTNNTFSITPNPANHQVEIHWI